MDRERGEEGRGGEDLRLIVGKTMDFGRHEGVETYEVHR